MLGLQDEWIAGWMNEWLNISLWKGPVVPDVSVVGETVAHVSQLALLLVLKWGENSWKKKLKGKKVKKGKRKKVTAEIGERKGKNSGVGGLITIV